MNNTANKETWLRNLKTGGILLAVIGAIDSAYLLFLKLTGNVAACGGIGDCESVNASRYAEFGGIPIALFGLLAYLFILLLFALESKFPQWLDGLLLANFGVTLAGTIYSLYLTYLEVFLLKAICPFCVVSAVVIIVLFIISSVRLYLVYSLDE